MHAILLAAALGCPDCPPAREARRLAFGAEFWPTLLVALAPFAVVLAIALVVVRLVDHRRQEPP